MRLGSHGEFAFVNKKGKMKKGKGVWDYEITQAYNNLW